MKCIETIGCSFFFFKQKTAYEMRISDWSSDVCSSDLNTIVVYTSDNGFFLGEHGFYDKRMMLEPSIRVPMLLRWPRRIKTDQVDDEHMVLNIDVAPTLLSLAGVKPPDWMQGESWTDFIDDGKLQDDAEWREDFLYEWFEYPAVHCARRSEEHTSEHKSLMRISYSVFC